MSFHLCACVFAKGNWGIQYWNTAVQVFILIEETILLEEWNHKICLICLDRNLKAAGFYNKRRLNCTWYHLWEWYRLFGLMIEIDDYFTFTSPNTRVISYTNDQKGCSTLLGVSFSWTSYFFVCWLHSNLMPQMPEKEYSHSGSRRRSWWETWKDETPWILLAIKKFRLMFRKGDWGVKVTAYNENLVYVLTSQILKNSENRKT